MKVTSSCYSRRLSMMGLCLALLLTSFGGAFGQSINPQLLSAPWHARWITCPTAATSPQSAGYGVYKFRKSFTLSTVPENFVIHVSADNRYKLYVNGHVVSMGPARGDLFYWNFETVDIAAWLVAGKNVLSAVVWNDGAMRPEAQISRATAFILQGDKELEEAVNTNDSWMCIQDLSYTPLNVRHTGYYVAGPGEQIEMKKQVLRWQDVESDDSEWQKPSILSPGMPKGVFTFTPVDWMLIPSPLPQMELSDERLQSVRKATGITVPAGFPGSKVSLTIPAATRATLLLDNGHLTNAYFNLIFSGGSKASISIGYTEALFIVKDEDISHTWLPELAKGNRNEVEGKTFIGKTDSLIADGSKHQSFTSLWWRTYRYVKITVQTRETPLVIEDIYGTFTGYPFRMNARLVTDQDLLKQNLEIGWRTARLCAFETYMDCPYYEQLQYIGDTRIQALVSLYNSGDDRLVRSAIDWMDRSRLAEGITLSRYPTASTQIIPTFSLWWIGMVHDYWRYRPDVAFVKEKLPGTRQVLNAFHHYQKEDGSIQNPPYWIFTDWVDHEGWNSGVAPLGADGTSSILDIQLFWTYQLAAELEKSVGIEELSKLYLSRAELLRKTIRAKYWDVSKGLFADTPEKQLYSQHANSLAILSGLIDGEEAKGVANKMLSDKSMAEASIYFKYYLHLALVKAGLGDQYLEWLDKWEENIKMGLTTWAEMSDVNKSRSDCHAWGSSPNIEFFRTVLGIDSDAPGFTKVRIEPHLGPLTKIGGSIPHPDGPLSVNYSLEKKVWKVEATLPSGLSGSLIWKGKKYELKSGSNKFSIEGK